MSEPIYDSDLVVHLLSIDDDVPVDVELISARSGPAGEAIIELSDAVRVSVDYAQPELLASISIMSSNPASVDRPLTPETEDLLSDLIGENRVEELGRVVQGGSDRPQRMPGSGTRRQNWSLGPQPTEEAIRLGQLASLSSIVADHGEAPSVRIVAALEGVMIGRSFANDRIRTGVEEQMRVAVESMIGPGDFVSLPEEVDDDLQTLVDDHRGVAQQVAEIAGRVATSSDERLSEIAELVLFALRREAVEPVLLAAFETVHTEMLSESLAFKSVTSIRDTEQPLMVDSAGAGRLELVWEEDPQGSWVRIMNPDDLTLVALVPVRREGGQWIAEAIVPPDRPLNTWIIEVTSAPLGSGSRTSTERIVEAVRLGQVASRMQRQRGTLQTDSENRAAWLACAAAWEELGDDFRANKARNFAGGERVTRRLQVADQVRTALGLEGI